MKRALFLPNTSDLDPKILLLGTRASYTYRNPVLKRSIPTEMRGDSAINLPRISPEASYTYRNGEAEALQNASRAPYLQLAAR